MTDPFVINTQKRKKPYDLLCTFQTGNDIYVLYTKQISKGQGIYAGVYEEGTEKSMVLRTLESPEQWRAVQQALKEMHRKKDMIQQ